MKKVVKWSCLLVFICSSTIAFSQDGGAKATKPPHPVRKSLATKKGTQRLPSGTMKQQAKPVRKEAVL